MTAVTHQKNGCRRITVADQPVLRSSSIPECSLCGTDKDNPDALFGWEGLETTQITSLEYRFMGTIRIGKMIDPREYFWLFFARPDPQTSDFLSELAKHGYFEFAHGREP